MSSRFYFGDDSGSDASDNDNDPTSLPFPAPLTRNAFLAPTFDPTTYLSSLTSSPRFQTLDDLHAELKALSSKLTTELVDLVNANYEQFLSLGAALRGGEEKVEEVRVGMMGFQRDVEGVRGWVEERRKQVTRLMEELRVLRKERNVGGRLLEVDRRMGDLEERLGLRSTQRTEQGLEAVSDVVENDEWKDWDAGEQHLDSEDSEDEADDTVVPPSLSRRVEEYLILRVLNLKLGPEHPFLINQRERMFKIRATLLVDLEAAMKNAQDDDSRKQIVHLRISLDEEIPQRPIAQV